MPRLLLLLTVLTTQPEGPSTLPEGLHATRVGGGVVQLQTLDGTSIPGGVQVGPGWYFTAYGYERLLVGRAELEEKYKVMRAQLEVHQQAAQLLELQLEKATVKAEGCGPLAAATCAAVAAASDGYSSQQVLLVALLALVLGLCLGLLVVLLMRQREREAASEG